MSMILFIKKMMFKRYFNMAVKYANEGNYKYAIKEYERAISLYSGYFDYYDAYWGLGKAYREIGNLDKAREVLSKAIEINPNYAESPVQNLTPQK